MKGSFVSEKFKIEDSSYSLLCQHLPGITEDNYRSPKSWSIASVLKLDTKTSEYEPGLLTTLLDCFVFVLTLILCCFDIGM